MKIRLNSLLLFSLALVTFSLFSSNGKALAQCQITYTTRYNTPNEWAADMTAEYDGADDGFTVRWYVKAQFTYNQWVDYTDHAYGTRNEFLTVEQMWDYCFDVYIVVRVGHVTVCTLSPQRICYLQP